MRWWRKQRKHVQIRLIIGLGALNLDFVPKERFMVLESSKMFLCDTTMVLGDTYWQLHAVLSIFSRKTLIFMVKRKNRASKSRKCHLESHQYDEMSVGSPIGHFYGLNWSTGRSPSEWLPSICSKTRGSLKIIEFIASFWEGRGSPQLGKIKSGN